MVCSPTYFVHTCTHIPKPDLPPLPPQENITTAPSQARTFEFSIKSPYLDR